MRKFWQFLFLLMLWLGLHLGIQGDWNQDDWNNKLLIYPWKLLSTPESSYPPLKAPIYLPLKAPFYSWKLIFTPESSNLPLKVPIYPWELLKILNNRKAPNYPWKLLSTPESSYLSQKAPVYPWKLIKII